MYIVLIKVSNKMLPKIRFDDIDIGRFKSTIGNEFHRQLILLK